MGRNLSTMGSYYTNCRHAEDWIFVWAQQWLSFTAAENFLKNLRRIKNVAAGIRRNTIGSALFTRFDSALLCIPRMKLRRKTGSRKKSFQSTKIQRWNSRGHFYNSWLDQQSLYGLNAHRYLGWKCTVQLCHSWSSSVFDDAIFGGQWPATHKPYYISIIIDITLGYFRVHLIT